MRKLRVLVAEDGLVNQKLAVGLLERRGHQALVANDGNEALEILLTEDIDLVLMDVQMPEMDGLEATRALREHEAKTGGHVPVVAMTAHAMRGDRERCLEAGMDDYIAKPIRSQELFGTIASVLGVAGDHAGTEDQPVKRGIIDWPQILEGLDYKRDLLVDLVEIALRECPRLLDDIRAAIDANDAKALRLHAHTLKGTIRYFGKSTAGELAFRLENLASNDELSEAATVFSSLESEVKRIVEELDDYLRSK